MIQRSFFGAAQVERAASAVAELNVVSPAQTYPDAKQKCLAVGGSEDMQFFGHGIGIVKSVSY